MALSQASTPTFEQFSNFDMNSGRGSPSFKHSPASCSQPLDFPDVYSGFDEHFPMSSLHQHDGTPFTPETVILGGISDQGYFDCAFLSLPQNQAVLPPLREEALQDPTRTKTQQGLAIIQKQNSTSITNISNPSLTLSSQPKIDEEDQQEPIQPKRQSASAKTSGRARWSSKRSRGKKQADPGSPAEMEKRAKFLERNKIAASKCRQRKKKWAADLGTKARELQINKESLTVLTNSLKKEVLYLKGEMLKHSSCSSTQVHAYLQNEIGHILGSCRGCSHCHHSTNNQNDNDDSSGVLGLSVTSNDEEDGQNSIANTASATLLLGSPVASLGCSIEMD